MMKRPLKAAAALVMAAFLFHGAPEALSAGPEEVAPPDLASLLREAAVNNPELNAMREGVRAREAAAGASGYLDDPTLEVEMMGLSTDTPADISPGSAMQTRYAFRQSLPFPGKLRLKERIAAKEALAARAFYRARELEVARLVKESYFNYAYLGESLRINTGIRELLSRMSLIAGARYASGKVSQQDVIRAQVELTSLTNEIIAVEAARDVEAARLKSLLYRDQSSELGPPPTLPAGRVEVDVRALVEASLKNSPEIRAAELEAEAGGLGADLARKDYYPDFMVGVAPVQTEDRFSSYDLMFQMSIPIWRGRYDARASEAAAMARSLRHRLNTERNMKGFEVKGAVVRVEAADRTRTLIETSLLPQVELSFDSAMKNYQAGKVDFLTLLDAERELRRTRLEHARSVLEYRLRVAELERAVGADL